VIKHLNAELTSWQLPGDQEEQPSNLITTPWRPNRTA